MYNTQVTLKFPNHNAYIRVDLAGRIHCFKYNNRTCDFAVFDSQFDAGDYVLEPLPTVYYAVTIHEE
jgi:hypothetical protein